MDFQQAHILLTLRGGGPRMKKSTALIFVTFAGISMLAYQNCANQVFQQEMSFKVSSTGDETPPICRDMTAEDVKPKLLYSWNHGADIMPTFNQVMASPVVGDLDGDKAPEIGFVSYYQGEYSSKGILRILNGMNGSSKFSIATDNLMPYATTAPLFVDIDGDGKAEIFYLHYQGKKAIALNHDGSLRWEFPLDFNGSGLSALTECRGGFSAADLDNKGKADILAGNWIISEDSTRQPFLRDRMEEVTPGCYSYAASLSTQANSELQIIGSSGVMNKNGRYLWKFLRMGYAASANLLLDVPGVEVVVTGNGYFTIYNGITGAVIADKKLSEHSDLICGLNGSGAPVVGGGQATIGDFDGNPNTLEIAVATGKSLTIFNSRGEKIAGSVTQDCSSLTTGLTSFDFNGDGKPEIIYADEQYVRVYEMDGSNNLKVIWAEINPTGTLREYPVVADVNGDGYAELVVVSNNMWVEGEILYKNEADRSKARNITGLRVFGPTKEKSWMPTRAVWNQHAYMAANVTDDLRATSSTNINGFMSTIFKRNTQKNLSQQVCTK